MNMRGIRRILIKYNAMCLATTVLLWGSQQADAQMFQNQFVEFKIPEQWECRVEGTEWVCMSSNPKIRKETLVVFAAKVAGEKDTLKEYLGFLQQPRRLTDLELKPIQSTVSYARQKNINGHTWVDALHKNSEIPGFFTRYLATTYQELGILVTYSVLESRWDAYEGMFRRMVESLKPRRGEEPTVAKVSPDTAITSIPIADLLEKDKPSEAVPQPLEVTQAPVEEEGIGLLGWVLIALLLTGVIGFIIYKRRKKDGAPPSEEGKEDEEEFEDEE